MWTLAELDGKDTSSSLEQNCKLFFSQLQRLEDGEEIVSVVDGRVRTLKLNLTYPADMSSHWSLFRVGGAVRNADSKPCHRCNCTYGEPEVVFDCHCVQRGETLKSIAQDNGIEVAELRLINACTRLQVE